MDIKLYLPSEPVLQHVIAADEHVITVAFGGMMDVALKEAMKNEYSLSMSTVIEAMSIAIPFLATEECGKPRVSLQKDFFTTKGGKYANGNVIVSNPTVADKLNRSVHGNNIEIKFEKDDLQLHMVGERNQIVTSMDQQNINDVNEYEGELQMSLTGPDFSICEDFPNLDVDLCEVYRNPLYNGLITESGSNVCQYWKPTSDVQTYTSTFHAVTMSDKMRNLLFLDEVKDVVESEVQIGTFEIRLVFPCIE
ncbi:hypothetical protein HOLleu_00397 [Holothuria leucospilota]|uniref:Uncharacterized protein n=1 Tax=Holothuria leucospilota TaxID=206669 RepID=A0A9Q1CNK3_HOLLE|nr:hypothetical protein HOLleu_00397 [Holothuria leucospilota]